MFHKLSKIKVLPNFQIWSEFRDGAETLYDLSALFADHPVFEALRDTVGLFEQAKIEVGGHGVVWNDDLDIDAEELYANGIRLKEATGNADVTVTPELGNDDNEYENVFETGYWKETTPGELLLGYRLKHGLTQEQLAEKTGIAQVTISAYETGKRKLSRRAAIRIGKALGENPDNFFP